MYRYLLEITMKAYFYIPNTCLSMDLKHIYLLLFFCLLSCSKKDSLTFEEINYDKATCQDCPKIDISILTALETSRIAEIINTSVREEIISLLFYGEENTATSISEAIENFGEDYNSLKQEFGIDSAPWEANVKSAISFEDSKVLTLKLESYLYTGGAHGYTTVSFLNFDKQEGVELENEELFKNYDDFKLYVENRFRHIENIPFEESINNTGFMFSNNQFYLPDTIGLTKEGLLLYYEPYLIAPYSDGAYILKFTFEELKDQLSFNIMD